MPQAMNGKRKLILASIAIGLSGFLFQVGLQALMRSDAIDGFYFQKWSSESLMQTVSIEDLRNAPLESLLNIHMQPPGLDAIRAVLVHAWPAADSPTSLRHVDQLLYCLWALSYGLLGLVVFRWMLRLTGTTLAIATAVLLLLHPATVFYATLLDTTLTTALLVLLLYGTLWRIKRGDNVPVAVVAVLALALFFTRSLFQWPFFLLLALSLVLVGMSRRRVLTFLLIAGAVGGVYLGKQSYQFGLASTSSSKGQSLSNSAGIGDMPYYWGYLDEHADLVRQEPGLPSVLTRERKIDGTPNFNHIAYLKLNQQLVDAYQEQIRTTPVSRLARYYRHSLRLYFKPSSSYTKHVIVDRIPWRAAYDWVFSAPVLVVLVLLAGAGWLMGVLRRRDYAAGVGLALPALYIFASSVLFDKGENMRYKFFLEPVLIVFLVSQLYGWGHWVAGAIRGVRRSHS